MRRPSAHLRLRAAMFVAIGALSVDAACSLTDLDGFAGGGDSTDAGPETGTITANEGGVDGGADTTVHLDAAPGTSPCSSAHTFCDDFDKGETLDPQWTRQLTGPPAGSIDLVTSRSLTAPRSARVAVVGDRAGSLLSWSPPAAMATKVHIAFDLYVETLVASGSLATVVFTLADDRIYTAGLYTSGATVIVYESLYTPLPDGGATFVQAQLSGSYAVPRDAWVHVEYEYGATISASFTPAGGATETPLDRRPLTYPRTIAGRPSVTVGVGDNVGAGVVNIDNVAIDAQ